MLYSMIYSSNVKNAAAKKMAKYAAVVAVGLDANVIQTHPDFVKTKKGQVNLLGLFSFRNAV